MRNKKDFFRDKSKNELFWGLISGPYFFNRLAASAADSQARKNQMRYGCPR